MLYARTNTGDGADRHAARDRPARRVPPLPDRLEAASVDYYVDGALVVTHAVTVAGPMRPVAASDFNPFGGIVFVDWMRMTPYATPGTFVSRVFDATGVVDWRSIQWTATHAGRHQPGDQRPRRQHARYRRLGGRHLDPVAGPGPLDLTLAASSSTGPHDVDRSDQTPALEDIIISTGARRWRWPTRSTRPRTGTTCSRLRVRAA